MIINEEGTYTLRYTATDSCGKTTTVDRTVEVASPLRTVLYTDGTFIINENGNDSPQNVLLHGEPVEIYDPLNEEHDYVFPLLTSAPWYQNRSLIKSVEIGSVIAPTDMSYWFYNESNCESFDLSNIDCSNLTMLKSTFSNCSAIESLDLSFLETASPFMSKVENIDSMCRGCTSLKTLTFGNFSGYNVKDLSRFCQSCSSLEVVDMNEFMPSASYYNERKGIYAFYGCSALTTIYCEQNYALVIGDNDHGIGVFGNCSTNLVGGNGTVWSQNETSGARARLDGGTSYPGYFTAKS